MFALRPTLVFLAVAVAACGGGQTTETVSCDPACPAGTRCTEQGCMADGPGLDLSAPQGTDLGGACLPACANPTPYCTAGGRCVACLTDDNCPTGTVCHKSGDDAFCLPGCTDDKRCQGGDGGAASKRCCGSACVDTTSDLDNCGACGQVCAPAHASGTCAGGACVPGACSSGWGDCDADAKTGCETNLRVDVKNCGACGTACTARNGTASCDGECYVSQCDFGFDDCDGMLANGCETSLLSDVNSCGVCNTPCPFVSRGKPTCVGGACGAQCDQGFADCNNNLKDGCEVQLSTNAQNCGGCGMACGQGLVCQNGACTCPQCNFPNAKSACVNLVCVLTSCLPGYNDCNNNKGDGCEVDLNGDAKNCGSCGTVCPQNLPSCVAGKCTIYQGLMQIVDPGMDKNVVLANGNGQLSVGLDSMDGSSNVIMTKSAATQVGGANAVGLPDNGFFPANNDHPDVQLAANNNNDGKKNTRILVKAGAFNVPLVNRTWKQIQLYAISTEGASTVVVTLNYQDGSSDQTTVTIKDWYTHPAGAGQFYLIDGLDRYSIANNKYDPAHTPGMVGWNLNVNPNKVTTSFDVQLQAGGWLVYFGAMGQ